jgi:hypothetical protein
MFSSQMLGIVTKSHCAQDTLAEWLRRRPAKPMGSPRAGSNPAGVDFLANYDSFSFCQVGAKHMAKHMANNMANKTGR